MLASFGTRLAGLLIDTAIMIAVGITLFVMALVVGVVSDALGSVLILLSYLAVFGVYFYFGYLIGTKGASPGMALMGLKCIGEQTGEPVGGPLGLARAFMTWIVSCCFYLGYLLFFVGDKRQTVGDMVASSVVTEGHPKSSLSLELFTP